MPSSYQYQPLSSPTTEIRLLELLPGTGMIQCRLKVTDLVEAKGTYEPISYCWQSYTRESWLGSTYKKKKRQKKCRVVVDGGNMHITESLHGALRQMRLDGKVRVLWADAICINQADDKEKNAQVAMMGDIYQGGFRTLAWLGEADRRTRKALEFLKDCSDRLSRTPTHSSRTTMQSSQTTAQSSRTDDSEPAVAPATQEISQVPAFHRGITALWDSVCRRRLDICVESIFGRPYFSRTWVVQEIAKSNLILFMCGKFFISWGDLSAAFSRLTYAVPGEHSFSALDKIWESLYDHDLMEVAMLASPTQASDPRDKLYGLLGLVPDDELTLGITVDYNKHPDQVFHDFTKLLLLSSTRLAVLSMSYGCAPNKPKHVPSWVWNPEPDEPYNRLSLPHSDSRQYQAARRSKSQPIIYNSFLGLRGIVLSTVTTVASCHDRVYRPNLPFHIDDPRQMLSHVLWYFEYRAISGVGGLSTDLTAANQDKIMFFHTTQHSGFSNKTSLPVYYPKDSQKIMDLDRSDSAMVERFGTYFSGEGKPLTSWTKFKLLVSIEKFNILYTFGDPAARHFADLIPSSWNIRNRRLGRTEEGHIMLCPKETKAEDKLVLLQGSDVPFILRRIGDHWQIVGECYVYALMDGSAWDESRCEMLWIE